ncbi:MAG: hypothetical protein ABH854_03260 [Candidatus Diapherotrites archaeon]
MGSKLILIAALFCAVLVFGCTTGQAGAALDCSDDDGADIQNRGEGDSCSGTGVLERTCDNGVEKFLDIPCPSGMRCVSGACEQ